MDHSYLVITVRTAEPHDATPLAGLYAAPWHGPIMVGNGTAYDLTVLRTLVAVDLPKPGRRRPHLSRRTRSVPARWTAVVTIPQTYGSPLRDEPTLALVLDR
jgi:hypothetical protein